MYIYGPEFGITSFLPKISHSEFLEGRDLISFILVCPATGMVD